MRSRMAPEVRSPGADSGFASKVGGSRQKRTALDGSSSRRKKISFRTIQQSIAVLRSRPLLGWLRLRLKENTILKKIFFELLKKCVK